MFFVHQIPTLALNQNTRHHNIHVHLLWKKLLSFIIVMVLLCFWLRSMHLGHLFDRVGYCKLFQLFIDRNMCPMFIRLLLYMYTHQKLRVKSDGICSESFDVTNGVKQGG